MNRSKKCCTENEFENKLIHFPKLITVFRKIILESSSWHSTEPKYNQQSANR